MSDAIFEATSISRSFSGRKVLQDCSLQLFPSEITLLLGANGSGKTTLLKICSGLLRAEKGALKSPLLPADLAYGAHENLLYNRLTVEENLRFFARLLKATSVDLDKCLDEWNLAAHRGRELQDLSAGLRARVALGRVFLNSPSLVFLDEPTTSLDESSVKILLGKLCELKESGSAKTSVLIATHDISRLSSIVDRIVILQDGKIIKDSRLERVNHSFTSLSEHYVSYYYSLNR
jgi:ABC-type multidrug transport system ATPase subunit